MNDQARYQRARQRVAQLRSFYTHLTVYLLVNGGLLLLNLVTSPGAFWFYWPLFGWGIGLVAHAAQTYGAGAWMGRDWEERKINELMSRSE